MSKGAVICIGGVLVDEIFHSADTVLAATSNPSVLRRSVGGVMGNVARNLAFLQVPVALMAVVGDDADAVWLEKELASCGVDTHLLIRQQGPSGKYAAIMQPDGALFAAACHDITEKHITPDVLEALSDALKNAACIVADTNLGAIALQWLLSFCNSHSIPLCIDPVSVSKARRIDFSRRESIYLITPNEDELPVMADMSMGDLQMMAAHLMDTGVSHVWLRLGAKGSVMFSKEGRMELPARPVSVLDATGAGDAALAGFLAGWYRNMGLLDCMRLGHALAFEVLSIQGAVADHVNFEMLKKRAFDFYDTK